MSDTPSLAPPNATAPERALEQAAARLGAVATPLATLWRADAAPAAVLPWLAWAVSVDVWDDAWPEPLRRAAIRDSVAVHRVKGTRGAVRRALAALEVRAALEEWWSTGEAPHTFRVTALAGDAFIAGDGAILDAAMFARIREMIDAVKPVRSHYSLSVGARFGADAGAGVSLRTAAVVRIRARIGAAAPHVAVGAGAGAALRAAAVLRARATLTMGQEAA